MDAAIGHGSDFLRGDGGGPEVFATVGQVNSISAPSISRDTADVTHMQSPEKWREVIGGLKDAGEMSVEFNFDPNDATTTSFLADINNDAAQNYRIAFPDATTWTFSALMTGFEPSITVEDKMTGTATFKLSGKPAFIA